MERAAGSETAALAAHTKNAVQKQTETHGDPIHNFNVTTKKHSYHARADGLPSISGDQEHRDAWSRQLRNKHHNFMRGHLGANNPRNTVARPSNVKKRTSTHDMRHYSRKNLSATWSSPTRAPTFFDPRFTGVLIGACGF